MSYFYANNFDIFGVVQQAHTSCAICEFSGITVFSSYFRLAENTRLRKSQTATGARTLAVRLLRSTTDRQQNEIIDEGINNIDSNFRTYFFGFSRDTYFGFYEKE